MIQHYHCRSNSIHVSRPPSYPGVDALSQLWNLSTVQCMDVDTEMSLLESKFYEQNPASQRLLEIHQLTLFAIFCRVVFSLRGRSREVETATSNDNKNYINCRVLCINVLNNVIGFMLFVSQYPYSGINLRIIRQQFILKLCWFVQFIRRASRPLCIHFIYEMVYKT